MVEVDLPVSECRGCPFYEPDPWYPTCSIRQDQSEPLPRVGEFPHYVSAEIEAKGAHLPPAWCPLRVGVVRVSLREGA